MIVLTHEECLIYEKIYYSKFKNNLKVEEESNKYNYIIHQKHDKIIKTVLDKKSEVVKFLNKYINVVGISEENLEKYNSSFISSEFKSSEADIIYKLKDRRIFFLIEHQSTVDYSMPYRILRYELEIIRSFIGDNIITKDYKIPTVIPIVIYTGKKKWNVAKSLSQMQEKLKGVIKTDLSQFHLVDIKKLEKKDLLQEDNLLSKIFILEKSKDKKEVIENLESIVPKIKNEDKEFMVKLIEKIFISKIGKVNAEKIIKSMKGEDEEMLAVFEMIEKENQMYINKRKKNWNKRRNKRRDRKGNRKRKD